MNTAENRIEEYIKAYQSLLEEKGYTEANLNNGTAPGTNARNIDEAFRRTFQNADEYAEGATITISTYGIFGAKGDKVGFDFEFLYKRQTQTIDLESMKFYGSGFSATVINRLNSAIPSLDDVLKIIDNHKHQIVDTRLEQRRGKDKGKGKRL